MKASATHNIGSWWGHTNESGSCIRRAARFAEYIRLMFLGFDRKGDQRCCFQRVLFGVGLNGSFQVFLGSLAHDRRLRSDSHDPQRPSVRQRGGVRRSVYCTSSFSVCSRQRTESPIIYHLCKSPPRLQRCNTAVSREDSDPARALVAGRGSFLKSSACSSPLSSGSPASSASSGPGHASTSLGESPRPSRMAWRARSRIAGDQSQSQQAIRGCDAHFTRQTEDHRSYGLLGVDLLWLTSTGPTPNSRITNELSWIDSIKGS